MTDYYRIILGRQNIYAAEAYQEGFIGGDWLNDIDFSNEFDTDQRSFNSKFIPEYLELRPEASKVGAGLACGGIRTIGKKIKIGDIILTPDGTGFYYVGKVIGDYYHVPGVALSHRRKVERLPQKISRPDMTQALQNSTGSIGTIANISRYAEEIELLIQGEVPVNPVQRDENLEDPIVFQLERHLEDFLINNWGHTTLGHEYDIYQEGGEMIGQQYNANDAGVIDILAISRDKKKLLVIELKRGRSNDVVLGQIQRYMGYVLEELAEEGQEVYGVIIGLEEDLNLRRALRVTRNISFYRYQIDFKLIEYTT